MKLSTVCLISLGESEVEGVLSSLLPWGEDITCAEILSSTDCTGTIVSVVSYIFGRESLILH